MKIIQITENLAYGDGSSNCIFYISAVLDELKYSNIIMAFCLDARIKDERIVKGDIYKPIEADKDDIIIYHLYAGNSVNYIIENLPLKKFLYIITSLHRIFLGVSMMRHLSRACGEFMMLPEQRENILGV